MTDAIDFRTEISFDNDDRWTSLSMVGTLAETVLDFDGNVRRAIDQVHVEIYDSAGHARVSFHGYSVKVDGERRGWDHYFVTDAIVRHPELEAIKIAAANRMRAIVARLEEKGI